MKAVFEVHATNEFASDYPSIFVLEVTEDLITEMEGLEAKCGDGVIRVVANNGDGVWGSEEEEQELRLYAQELVVNEHGSLYFQAFLKHMNWHLETQETGIAKLRSDFESGKKLVFYGDEKCLKELYEESLEVTA